MEEPLEAVTTAPEPLPEAPRPADLAAEGMRAVELVMRSTEAEVSRIAEEAREEVRRLAGEADAATARDAGTRRMELARVRSDLLDRATLLAQGFEDIFNLLDAAEAELAAGGVPTPGEAPRAEPGAVRLVVRERRRITVAHDVEPTPQPQPPPAAVQPPRQARRWWQLWRRRAA
jgi:hypothetical protein